MIEPSLVIGYRGFRLSRQDHVLEECQDASAGDPRRGRFAIADGAAESPYSALWAQLLVEEFVRQSERLPRWANWLPALQDQWAAQTAIRYPLSAVRHPPEFAADGGQRIADSGAGVPWYLEPGLTQGAFATFLGLVIEETSWQAVAVGDSCLFQVRQGELVRTFPIAHAADFSNAPWLVGSRTSPGEVPHKNGLQQEGDWEPGDRFWLMTDALAHWFLVQVEADGKPWLALEPLLLLEGEEAQYAFDYWIEGLRAARRLRNDDVTLLAINL